MTIFQNSDLTIAFAILLALTIVAVVFSIISYGKYNELNRKYNLFMTGKDAESLEEFCMGLQNDIDFLMDENQKNKESIKALNRITKNSFQKIGIHKYDAFEEKTGKRSFAMALLDFTNTGFVVTCQNNGGSTVFFLKEVDAGSTTVKLGPEEEIALVSAIGQQVNKE